MSMLPLTTDGAWALYDADGNPAVEYDVFLACTCKAEAKATQNPVEKGQFADYNKALQPRALGVVLTRSGTSDALSGVLEKLDALVESTDLLSLVTPEKTFVDYTLTSYDYDRKVENGVDRLILNLMLEEIRQIEPEYSNEQVPPAKSPKQGADKGTQKQGKQSPQTVPEQSPTGERVWKKHDSVASKAL